MPLNPVILTVPDRFTTFMGRARNIRLSALARRAVVKSAALSNLKLTALLKNGHGAPLPCKGIHWSLSHKNTHVAGVVATHPIGIDIEEIRPRTPGLFAKIAASSERALGDPEDQLFFYKVWTAKEAVLKAAGIGLRDMRRCRLQRVRDHNRLVMFYEDRLWPVSHHYFNNLVAAITVDGDSVCWHTPDS